MKKKSLSLDWQIPKVLVAPIRGASAKQIYDEVPEFLKRGLTYNDKTQEVIGSTPFAVAGFNDVAEKYDVRVPKLKDLSLQEVLNFVRGRHYVESNSLVARTQTDSNYPKNNSLLKTLYELAEQELGRIENPFIVEGFAFVENPDDKTGYGLTLVKKPDFKIVQDERLQGKYHQQKFSEVDEIGLPLFDKNGIRNWYARNNGLSGVCLLRDLDLGSGDRVLDNSDGSGRVVLLTALGGSQKILEERISQLKTKRDRQISEINERYKKAEDILKG